MKIKQLAALITIIVNICTTAYAQLPSEENHIRQREYLTIGTIAVRVNNGVYISWRLLGTESLNDQAFDIYRNDKLIHTTDISSPTCYTDTAGAAGDTYKVVRAGESTDGADLTKVWTTNITGSYDDVVNSAAYLEFPIERPTDDVIDIDGSSYSYDAGDVSVGDLDGDGEYEIILKWDPSNQQDNGSHAYTGIVYIDAYKTDGTKLWRINMGKNIRAGAHYTQVIVYDFDCDGKAEIAMKTAPGTIDGEGNYVTEAGTSEEIRNADNTADYRTKQNSNTPQRRIGHIIDGPEYLTMFNGESGAAMQTIAYDPVRGEPEEWGDGYGNRCNRYLAGVAYLDGQHPSLLMCRGYYARSAIVAYDWDGINFRKKWIIDSSNEGSEAFAGQGNHSLIVSDVDNDKMDEIVYGSAIVDNDGTLMNSTGHGHGDVLHVSDFDNDGKQEIFQTHEDYTALNGEFSTEYRKADTGEILFSQSFNEDVAKGVMSNFDDDYAVKHPESKSLFWSSSAAQFYDNNGTLVAEDNSPSNRRFYKHFLYWDGKLDRELLDGTMLAKLKVTSESKFTRFFFGRTGSFADVNATTGGFPLISADIFGDWREEVVMRTPDNNNLRIYMSCIPTEYRIPTLMHDSQYRTCIAAENVAYNQVPHTSYYIGTLALAEDEEGNKLNYLNPKTPYTDMEMILPDNSSIKIINAQITENNLTVELKSEKDNIMTDIILAVYDKNGFLEKVDVSTQALKRYKNVIVFSDVNINELQTYKIFIWDSVGKMRPI